MKAEAQDTVGKAARQGVGDAGGTIGEPAGRDVDGIAVQPFRAVGPVVVERIAGDVVCVGSDPEFLDQRGDVSLAGPEPRRTEIQLVAIGIGMRVQSPADPVSALQHNDVQTESAQSQRCDKRSDASQRVDGIELISCGRAKTSGPEF